MNSVWVSQATAILITLTALALLVATEWRLCTLLLAAQYMGIFLLRIQVQPIAIAAAQLIAGWIACLVLALTMANLSPQVRAIEEYRAEGQTNGIAIPFKPGKSFFFLAASLVGMILLSRLPDFGQWFPSIPPTMAWTGLILISLGMLRLGYSDRVFSTFLGLLTLLAGFETLYAPIQTSLLLTGLLAGIHLSLALTGAYLLVSSRLEGSG